jgi:hypothetical protein
MIGEYDMKRMKKHVSLLFVSVLLLLNVSCAGSSGEEALSKEYIEDLRAKHYYARLMNIAVEWPSEPTAVEWPSEPSAMEEAMDGDAYERINGERHEMILDGQ